MSTSLTDTSIPDPPGAELLRKTGLSQEEYERVCTILKRKPNLVEMGVFGAMWSEHCSYKTSRRYLKKLPVEGKAVLQGPGEQAGVMDLGNDYAVVFKIESHNHPSAVEPFQGAATGVGGIIRDIFAMGARPIALLNSLRFGNPKPLAPVGDPPGSAPAESAQDAQEAEVAVPPHQSVDWAADPKPYVFTITWMTDQRRQVFARANIARAGVDVIRAMHDDAVSSRERGEPPIGACEVLAYCLLPDQLLLAGAVYGGDDNSVAEIAAVLKARLAELAIGSLRPGEALWETGHRAQRRFDQNELDEAIKRMEYSPVQRNLAKHVKEFPFVSAVWRHGTAWPDQAGADSGEAKSALPFCPGVTEEQAARNRYLLNGVVSGIAHYGNCIGIPTVGGEVAFDPSYSGNCIVNAMCVGIMKKGDMLRGVASGPGNTALIVGAKTGRDGVQGATFASADLGAESHEDRPAVQVGDPFMEKLLLEATLEIMKLPGLVGVQDFGAAGLTCSSVEMAAKAGTGMRLNLDAVPQRALDLSAYEMMLSESQERMMVVVKAGMEQPFMEVFRKWGLTAVECGTVLPQKTLIVVHHGNEVAVLPNGPLANEAPDYDRPVEEPAYYKSRRALSDADIADCLSRIGGAEAAGAERHANLLRALLSHPSIASKRPVFQQYDYLVRANTLLSPGQGDAAVLRVKETGQGIALSTDCTARHVYLDPRIGTARAVLESARNVIAVGAQPLGITNNLNFGNPEKPDRMWQFVQAVEGMREALIALELPVTGGNVSLYNETTLPGVGSVPILPTPVIGMVGLLAKAEHCVPGSTAVEGLEVFMLGSSPGRLDGSALCFDLGRLRAGELAVPDYREFRSCERFLVKAAAEGALKACHDISDGGLAVALAEMFPGGVSADLAAGKSGLPDNYNDDAYNKLAALFGESGNRWLIAVTPEQRGWLRTAALHYSIPLTPLGSTGGSRLRISFGAETLLDCESRELTAIYNSALANALASS